MFATKKECFLLKERYINFNDPLRAFIKEANRRVENGENVIVVLTGDITDYYFDGYWNGEWVCIQGGQWPNRREQAAGSAWNSNIRKFHEIITGRDGKGEALKCPIFTIPGNHEYYANEILMNFRGGSSLANIFVDAIFTRHEYRAFGLNENEAREYDFWAYPRINGKDHQIFIGTSPVTLPDSIAVRKTFKEIKETPEDALLPRDLETLAFKYWQASLVDSAGDKSYWLMKPNQLPFSQYLSEINYDMDFELSIGNCHLLFLNTGHDIYPTKEEFQADLKESSHDPDGISIAVNYPHLPSMVRDFKKGGPHSRGITPMHKRLLDNALSESREKLIFIFTHAPLLGLEKAETVGVECLYEENLKKGGTSRDTAIAWLKRLYGMKDTDLQRYGFVLDQKGFFKQGKRDPYLDFFGAEGCNAKGDFAPVIFPEFLNLLSQEVNKSADKPILVFLGHTHKVHEFRVKKIGTAKREFYKFYYYIDDYSGKYFKKTEDGLALLLRYRFLKAQSPLLLTSDALKNKNPKYREIVVRGLSLASLEMKTIANIQKTGDFSPRCKLIALRAHNGQYVCAEDGGKRELMANRNGIGPWEAFEMTELEDGHVALKACNEKFVHAEGGGGGKLKPDRSWIKDHETFLLVVRGENKIALRTHNGKYVCAESGGGRELIANREQAREWETFELIEIKPYHITLSAPEQPIPPTGKQFNKEQVITLSWKGVWGAWSYVVEVEEKIGNQWQSKKQGRTAGSSFSIGFTSVGSYRWRVWAVREDGQEGPKSGWWMFSVRSIL